MACRRLPLVDLPWSSGPHPLERKKAMPDLPVTWIEFAPGFEDPAWCVRGHAGLVVRGAFALELEQGRETFHEGEAFWLDPGTRHRALNPGATPVVLFLVSRD